MNWLFDFSKEINEISLRNDHIMKLEKEIQISKEALQGIHDRTNCLNSEQQRFASCDIETSKQIVLQLQSIHDSKRKYCDEISKKEEQLLLDETRKQQKSSLGLLGNKQRSLNIYLECVTYVLWYVNSKNGFMPSSHLGDEYNLNQRLEQALKIEQKKELKLDPIRFENNISMTLAAYLKQYGIYPSTSSSSPTRVNIKVFITSIPCINKVLNTIKEKMHTLDTWILDIQKYKPLSAEETAQLNEQMKIRLQDLEKINAQVLALKTSPTSDISLFLNIASLLNCDTQEVTAERLNEYFAKRREQLVSLIPRYNEELQTLQINLIPLKAELKEKIQALVQRYNIAIHHLKCVTLIGASLALVLSLCLGSVSLLAMAGVTATYGLYQSSSFFKKQVELQHYAISLEEQMVSDDLRLCLQGL